MLSSATIFKEVREAWRFSVLGDRWKKSRSVKRTHFPVLLRFCDRKKLPILDKMSEHVTSMLRVKDVLSKFSEEKFLSAAAWWEK